MVVPLNRRVTVLVVASSQNEMGGNVPGGTVVDSWIKWAHVENRTGSNQFNAQQQVWNYDYKIIMRRESSRPTQSNYELQYEGHRLKIESISIDSEGYKGYEICRCSKIDEVVTTPDTAQYRITSVGNFRTISPGNFRTV